MNILPFLPTTLTIDAYDIAALGAVVEEAPGARASVGSTDATVVVPGVAGAALLDATPAVSVREFTMVIGLVATSTANLHSAYRQLQFRTGGGDRVLILSDDTSRRITARRKAITVTYLETPLGGTAARVELAWQARTPYWEDTSDTVVNLTTTPAACALGTAEVAPVVVINQNCTITYKDSAGTTLDTLVITGIGGGQSASIDMRTRRIVHSVTGALPSMRTSGTFFWLDPYDGDYPSSAWPTITLSAGTGTATYKKAWQA